MEKAALMKKPILMNASFGPVTAPLRQTTLEAASAGAPRSMARIQALGAMRPTCLESSASIGGISAKAKVDMSDAHVDTHTGLRAGGCLEGLTQSLTLSPVVPERSDSETEQTP